MTAEISQARWTDAVTEQGIKAQQDYTRTFLDIVSARSLSRANYLSIKQKEELGYQTTLRAEIHEGDDQIDLPESLHAVIAQAFRGFPIDNETYLPQLRVNGVLFLYNRVAIDVEPTVETPRREGRERQFITFPDYSRAVSRRIGFFIDKGDYTIGFGNPNGPSEWMTSHGSLIPFKGEKVQLAPEVINDLTTLANKVNERPHSDLIIHKAHS